MDIRAKEKDFMQEYKESNAEGRLNIMLENYYVFPKIIRKMETKTQYRIKCEKEYQRSKHRGELGVRTQNSNISDPTCEEAVTNVMIEESFKTGEIEKSILKGLDNAEEYENDIRVINIMRMDFELLEEIVNDLEDDDSRCIKDYLTRKKLLKEIAADEGKSYVAMKKRVAKIKSEIRDEIIDCLRLNCREADTSCQIGAN